MIAKYTYNDLVRVAPSAASELRPGMLASVVAITPVEIRSGNFLKEFPSGTLYTIEFDDGTSVTVEESDIELVESA